MTFIDWWESDERFALAHEDEATQARAAWNAAIEMAALACERSQTGHGKRGGLLAGDGPDAARRNCAILIRELKSASE